MSFLTYLTYRPFAMSYPRPCHCQARRPCTVRHTSRQTPPIIDLPNSGYGSSTQRFLHIRCHRHAYLLSSPLFRDLSFHIPRHLASASCRRQHLCHQISGSPWSGHRYQHYQSRHIHELVGCVLGKSHGASISKVRSFFTSHLPQLVHSDVLGSVEVLSLGGARYFLSCTENFSRWTVLRAIIQQYETLYRFKDHKASAQKTHL